jgi:Domain of unknown function (DUF4296)
MMKFNFYILSFTILLISGCSNDKILDETKFVKVYTDLVIANDTLSATKSNFDSVKQTVFKRYGITSGQYDSTVNYYNKDMKRWESFFNTVTSYIDTLRSNKNSTKSSPKENLNSPLKNPSVH